ncbi:MAG: acetate--CoA ligase family protein [Bdellovibrionota bacterium]
MLGPNCLGIINAHHKMNASFAKQMPLTGSISVLSQSGALCAAILDWAEKEKVGFSKVISMGNKSDLDENDFIEALAEDEDTKVITCYLESINNGAKFMDIASKVSKTKPIVIFKSGTTASGSKAASSHTGSLAGADVAYSSAFHKSGVIRAHSFESLFDISLALSMQKPPKGKNVAVITNAGGPGIMATDAVENSGMNMAVLDKTLQQELAEKLSAAASVANPIDILGDGSPEKYAEALIMAQKDPNVDAVVVILTPQAMTKAVESAEEIAKNMTHEKPVLAVWMGGVIVDEGRDVLSKNGIPNFTDPVRAITTLKTMLDYGTWLNKKEEKQVSFNVDKKAVEEILADAKKKGLTQLGEVETKAMFKAYGIDIPQGGLAKSKEEAGNIAEQAGYPIAMKISSPDIVHKSDVGGVKLFLKSKEEVEAAFEEMTTRIAKSHPKANIVGTYLERMCDGGKEVIIGMTRDPQFGPMIMFGLGGIFVEVMKDVVFKLAPLSKSDAMEMISSIKSYPILAGVRGHAGYDVEKIADVLQRVSQLIIDFPEIKEMDINPFFVGEKGKVSLAADGRMSI